MRQILFQLKQRAYFKFSPSNLHIRGKYAESITTYHLLYGRGVSRKNTLINYFIEVSELSNICKQLANLTKYSTMNISLRYVSNIHTIVKVILFKTYPFVILYQKKLSIYRLCWKKGHIAKLIKGNESLVQGVTLDIAVSNTNKTLHIDCPFQHIIPSNLKILKHPIKTLKLLILITVNPP